MTKICMMGLVFGLLFGFLLGQVRAHDDGQWVQDRAMRNQAGEWCCGKGDCHPIEQDRIHRMSRGYRIDGGAEFIPFTEAMPLSVDGRLWVCRRPDGTRRCVFDEGRGS